MENRDIVQELRSLLGEDVLLLACKPGTKRPIGKWGELTISAMRDPEYLAKLRRSNIGVALGPRSGGLCSLDIDDDQQYAEFVSMNVEVCKTLRTRGARGANIWWRLSDYPSLTPLKRNGAKWGEWRADGAQTVIHGTHPSGGRYSFVQKLPPRTIKLSEIVWPKGITPLLGSGEVGSVTECTEITETSESSELIERSERTECTDAYRSGVVVSSGVLPIQSFEEAVAHAIPKGMHENHACLFTLARAVKALEINRGGELSLLDKRKVFDLWHARARAFLQPDLTTDDYWFEFLDGYENAMSGLGINLAEEAWKRVQGVTPPPEAATVSEARVKALVSLCRQMWLMSGRKPFFLSVRTVQRFFGLQDCMRASRWLIGLQRSKILRVTEPGSQKTMKASRFVYLPSVD